MSGDGSEFCKCDLCNARNATRVARADANAWRMRCLERAEDLRERARDLDGRASNPDCPDEMRSEFRFAAGELRRIAAAWDADASAAPRPRTSPTGDAE